MGFCAGHLVNSIHPLYSQNLVSIPLEAGRGLLNFADFPSVSLPTGDSVPGKLEVPKRRVDPLHRGLRVKGHLVLASAQVR